MEIVIAVGDAAAAIKCLLAEMFSQTRQRRHNFKSRARRQCADRAIHERIGFVLLQRFPIFCLDARNESVRVERWH